MSGQALCSIDEILALVSEHSGLSREKLLDHLEAQITGVAQHIERHQIPADANTDFFAEDFRIKPKLAASLFRIQIRASFSSGSPKLRVRTYLDSAQLDSKVLSDDTFVTNVSRSFDFQTTPMARYGFFFDAAVTVEEIIIDEIPITS